MSVNRQFKKISNVSRRRDGNIICSWMREYRRENQMPTYSEEKGIRKSAKEEESELKRKNKEKDLEIQRLKKENARLTEEKEILKKCLIKSQSHNTCENSTTFM